MRESRTQMVPLSRDSFTSKRSVDKDMNVRIVSLPGFFYTPHPSCRFLAGQDHSKGTEASGLYSHAFSGEPAPFCQDQPRKSYSQAYPPSPGTSELPVLPRNDLKNHSFSPCLKWIRLVIFA